MAKSLPNNSAPVKLITVSVCMAMLASTGLALSLQIPGFSITSPLPEITKCWSSITTIPSCLTEVYDSFLAGQIGRIGPACCTAINGLSDDCLSQMFPISPFFPSLLKNFCAAPTTSTRATGASKLFLPTSNVTEITECWSSITHTEGCTLQIYKSLTSGQITGIGPACCKVVTETNDKCWPKMFPFNPFFPPLLNSTCAKLIEAAPTPKAI